MSTPGFSLTRRAWLLAGALALLTPFAAQADAWPSKPIKLVVPYPPGGAADATGRLFAEKLSEALKQAVVVENKPGAGTTIAADYVAKAPADGYTLGLAPTGQLTILPHLAKQNRLEPLTAFTPIAPLSYTSVVIAAAPNFPAATLKDVVARAKARPGEVTFSSSGSATIIHLAGEYFASEAGVKLLHVPFKGSAPAVTALLGGEVNLAFDTLTVLAPQIKAGKVKGLAIAARERSPLLPVVPTVAEAGYPQVDAPSWFGLVGPAQLPKAIVKRLSDEVATLQRDPTVKERLAAQGLQAWGGGPEAFTQQIRADYAKYGAVVRQAGIRFD